MACIGSAVAVHEEWSPVARASFTANEWSGSSASWICWRLAIRYPSPLNDLWQNFPMERPESPAPTPAWQGHL
eukprot:5366951-Amphidinium_carterae.1